MRTNLNRAVILWVTTVGLAVAAEPSPSAPVDWAGNRSNTTLATALVAVVKHNNLADVDFVAASLGGVQFERHVFNVTEAPDVLDGTISAGLIPLSTPIGSLAYETIYAVVGDTKSGQLPRVILRLVSDGCFDPGLIADAVGGKERPRERYIATDFGGYYQTYDLPTARPITLKFHEGMGFCDVTLSQAALNGDLIGAAVVHRPAPDSKFIFEKVVRLLRVSDLRDADAVAKALGEPLERLDAERYARGPMRRLVKAARLSPIRTMPGLADLRYDVDYTGDKNIAMDPWDNLHAVLEFSLITEENCLSLKQFKRVLDQASVANRTHATKHQLFISGVAANPKLTTVLNDDHQTSACVTTLRFEQLGPKK